MAIKTKSIKESNYKRNILEQHYGNSHRLEVDKDFVLDIIIAVCETDGMDMHVIITGIPIGDGQFERVHKVLQKSPSVYCKIYLAKIWYAIIETFHQSNATSPYELLFGVKLKTAEEFEIMRLLDQSAGVIYLKSRASLRGAALLQSERVQGENQKD